MKTVLITGATGWIGSALASQFESDAHYSVIHCSRRKMPGKNWRQLPELTSGEPPAELFHGVDAVVHTAARAHHPGIDSNSNTEQLYDSINSQATIKLATSAADAGVSDFIFLSSIKAVGDSTTASPFDENTPPHPSDAYGRSKLQAEKNLLQFSQHSPMRIHILRLPLVVSHSAKGNLKRLESLLRTRIPLPLANINNQRSLLSLHNLIDATIRLVKAPPLHSDLYCLCDDEPLSTPELMSALGASINCPAKLWRFPTALLKLAFHLIRKRSEWERLAGSLTVSNTKFKRTMNWTPTLGSIDAFKKAQSVT